MPVELSYSSFSCKLCSGLVKFKISLYFHQVLAATVTSVKEHTILKWCCNPLNFSSIANFTKTSELLAPVVKKWLCVQKGHRKLLKICQKVLEMKQLSFKIEQLHVVSALNKTLSL
jgi:hypothetical protein